MKILTFSKKRVSLAQIDVTPYYCPSSYNLSFSQLIPAVVGIYGQYQKRYCFVTLTFNFKVTGGLLKVTFGHFSHFGPVLIYRKLDHPMAGIYNTYIYMSSVSMQKFYLEALQ